MICVPETYTMIGRTLFMARAMNEGENGPAPQQACKLLDCLERTGNPLAKFGRPVRLFTKSSKFGRTIVATHARSRQRKVHSGSHSSHYHFGRTSLVFDNETWWRYLLQHDLPPYRCGCMGVRYGSRPPRGGSNLRHTP